MVTVTHNPLVLPVRKLCLVRNARQAELILDRFCETKDDRGLRLRYVPDHENHTIELGGRLTLPVDMALKRLSEAGQFIKFLPWTSKMISLKRSKEKYATSVNIYA